MAHRPDSEIIAQTRNTARFFAENRQIAWVLLIGTVLWGLYGYQHMPQRKDPDIPVRVAVATCQWPGVSAEQVEQLVTRPIEQTIASSPNIYSPKPDDFGIKSMTITGLAIVHVQLAENITDTKKVFNDINLKLMALNSKLPQGAGPIQFNSDFGDTAALMLTVASPQASEVDVALRARGVQKAIKKTRASRPEKFRQNRVSLVYCFPASVSTDEVLRGFQALAKIAAERGYLEDMQFFDGSGFVALDAITPLTDSEIMAAAAKLTRERLHESEIHPDAWQLAIIRDPQQTEERLKAIAGEKYSYRELDDFTDLIARTLLGATQVAKVDRSGVLPEQVYLDYSQERLASYGVQPANLSNILNARNISLPGGALEVDSKNVVLDPSGQFEDARAIGNVVISTSNGSPVYLRDLVSINRGYQSPARFLNYYTWRDKKGKWHRSRAVTLAVQMRSGEQIRQFARSVDEKLASVEHLLPSDLIIARTSDQPRQVKENISLFMDALYEAILLVVLVSWIGFWEWRSALLMALSIPITLAMTFGFAYVLGIDLQQVSIATLIIALGLLVDDPVVAGDSIKRSLADDHPPLVASWLGPTKLARAILFATITNIVAYLPFLMLSGNTGKFLYSLPVVMTCALVASRLVSMTFIPLLGYYLLRPSKKPERSLEEREHGGFTGFYYRVGTAAIEHRYKVLLGSLVFLFLGAWAFRSMRTQFFPEDVQYWSYLDIRLPNDAPLSATNSVAEEAERTVRDVTAEYTKEHAAEEKNQPVLHSLTTFVGGGGPRFWFSVTPELQQLNYAQVIIQVNRKEDTPRLASALQAALSAKIPGARVDFRQLETNPVDVPIQIRISAQADVSPIQSASDIAALRAISKRVQEILRAIPLASRVRDDWGEESSTVKLEIDPDRANLAGVTNLDVAQSTTTALSGYPVTTLREGDKQIPVVARLRMEERSRLSDIQNLYVYSSQTPNKVPLLQISQIKNTMETQRIRRLEHFRTITVQAFPASGHLASEIMSVALPKLEALKRTLPPGYTLVVGGEYAKQQTGFRNLAVVLLISIALIFLALVVQFNHAVKPLLVFAATPYGVVGSLLALWATATPFGFMAFLGIASLVGVIVSHVIVLFDFIEEMHEKGEPLRQALLDAGIQRLRPVLITVGATVLALFPLAVHGGPLWQPLCYAQIGGLTFATFVTLLLVPVLYSIFVLDLKIVEWKGNTDGNPHHTVTQDS
jgi:multidrug efflux pump subunit AcrB